MNPRKNDFERAVSLLHRDGYTCVLCDRDRVLTSREHGLAPLIRLLDTNESLQDMAAADRLIGRAAALLLLAAGVKAVYGEVMSEEAHRLLSDAGVRTEYGTLVPEILNRAGTAPCPMEQAAAAVTSGPGETRGAACVSVCTSSCSGTNTVKRMVCVSSSRVSFSGSSLSSSACRALPSRTWNTTHSSVFSPRSSSK